MPNLGSPKMRGKCSPRTHTHTLPWLWLCATLIDVPAKPASPRHAPTSTDCCCLYVYGCDCLASATDIDFHTRATAVEQQQQQRQQLQRRCCSRMIPALERRSCHNFLIIRKILCQQKRRTACTGSPREYATHTNAHTHTQMELVGRQVLCNIFGLPLPAAVATKTNLCSCAAHSNTTSNVPVCVVCVRVCV